MTTRDPEVRVREQYATVIPYGELPYEIVFETDAITNNNQHFSDHDIHYILNSKGILRGYSEWFRCSVKDIEDAIQTIKGDNNELLRSQNL